MNNRYYQRGKDKLEKEIFKERTFKTIFLEPKARVFGSKEDIECPAQGAERDPLRDTIMKSQSTGDQERTVQYSKEEKIDHMQRIRRQDRVKHHHAKAACSKR